MHYIQVCRQLAMYSVGPHYESQCHLLHLLQLSEMGGRLQKGMKCQFTAFSCWLFTEDINVKTLCFPFWVICIETGALLGMYSNL